MPSKNSPFYISVVVCDSNMLSVGERTKRYAIKPLFHRCNNQTRISQIEFLLYWCNPPTCWMNEPPDFPRGFPMTSTAALPLVFCSASRLMYAISLHGSNNEYLLLFDKMFCLVL